jgi:hypothetical protein
MNLTRTRVQLILNRHGPRGRGGRRGLPRYSDDSSEDDDDDGDC